MQFVLASHNKKKLAEMATILGGLGIEVLPLPENAPEPEETGTTFEENALIKARSAADFTGLPAIADDSGLCVDAPGATAWEPMQTAMRFYWRICGTRTTAPAGSCARSRASCRTGSS